MCSFICFHTKNIVISYKYKNNPKYIILNIIFFPIVVILNFFFFISLNIRLLLSICYTHAVEGLIESNFPLKNDEQLSSIYQNELLETLDVYLRMFSFLEIRERSTRLVFWINLRSNKLSLKYFLYNSFT